jgi:alpha-L-rhamnosidase
MNDPETSGMLSAVDLRCEYLENPLGVEAAAPRLSWQVRGEGRSLRQSAYQVQVAENPEGLTSSAGLLWDTSKISSDQTTHIAYQGEALKSGQRAFWRVRAWDQNDQPGAWSETAFWEMGLLHPADWQAQWIEPDWQEDPQIQQPCPYLRHDFSVQKTLQSARVYITSHGVYELTLNGQPVTEDIFTPGYTAYQKRLQYQVYDVTGFLQEGECAVGVILGDGWWRGKIGVNSVRNAYGEKLALLLQLHLRYSDGSQELILSDETWKANAGPILMADLKDGEKYDARLEMPGWDQPGFDDSGWRGVRRGDYGVDNLAASCGVPVRRQELIPTAQVLQTPSGDTVVDLGQNIAGRVRLKVSGPAGAVVTLTHGEVLDAQGNFTQKNLALGRQPKDFWFQKVSYTLKGEGEEVYEPRFTFHGFRYVKVEGFPGELAPENLTGVAIYSNMPASGTFSCSSEMLNQLQSNITWSQKGNFLDIPTDCPQRERAGWTGDAQIFARTGSFIMETAAFFTKWLKDLAAEQYENGLVTNLVPNAFEKSSGFFKRLEGSAGWGDAAVIIPWTLYLCYADRGILEQQYASMKAWVDYAAGRAAASHWARRLEPATWFSGLRRQRLPYLWDTGYHWGEWLEPDAGSNMLRMFGGMLKRLILSEPEVATPYLAYSSGLLAKIAHLIGKPEDAAHYETLSSKVKAAYTAEFVRPDGRIHPHKQASYVRALAFELTPAELRPKIAAQLADMVRQNGNHLGTGFLSTPFLCHVLSQYGYLDIAYALLNQKTIPSWLYAVTKGATTIWESWDGIKEDGSVNASHNHYSYGAIGSWMYQVVAGLELDPDAPGYKHFIVQPHPGGGLTHARAAYQSLHGPIVVGWYTQDQAMHVDVEAPPNTTARVRLPAAAATYVTESGIPLEEAPGVHGIHTDGHDTVFEIDSGSYSFVYTA